MPVLKKKEGWSPKLLGFDRNQISTISQWKYRYNSKSTFCNEDFKSWLTTFQKEGVTLSSLFAQVEDYIDTNLEIMSYYSLEKNETSKTKTSSLILAGSSATIQNQKQYRKKSSTAPAYLYAHTIEKFHGVALKKPIVIYIGISTDEKIHETALTRRFSRGTDKNKRSFMWHTALQQAGESYQSKAQRISIHIYPMRIIVLDILKLEEHFIRKLGCLVINPNTKCSEGKTGLLRNPVGWCNHPTKYFSQTNTFGQRHGSEPKHGSLTNIKTTNGNWDLALHSQRIKEHFDRNPQLKGKGGTISNQQKRNWENNPERREANRERLNNYFATITPEEKKEHYDALRKTLAKIEKWAAASFLQEYAYDSSYWCPNGGSLFENKKSIEISDEYTSILRKIQESPYFTRVPRSDKARKAARKFGQTLVFPEYDGKKAKKYLKKNVPSELECKVFHLTGGYWIPDWFKIKEEYRQLTGVSVPKNERHQTLKADFDTWCVNYLESYTHPYQASEIFDSSGTVINQDFKNKLEIAKQSQVYTYVKRLDCAKSESSFSWESIYFETPRKRGPGWKPNKRLLKKKYKKEKDNISNIRRVP